ncbi:hypothetical protein Tco_1552716 [Tanacetum coccineum]
MSNIPNRGVVQRGQSSSTAPRPNNFGYNRQGGGSGLVCENYGFNGHIIDRCFKIIGYPVDFRKKKSRENYKGKNVSNNVIGSGSSSGFTDEQMATLISLIKDNKNEKNDKARDAAKKKGSRLLRSSSKNEEALARLMVTKMTDQEKEQRDAILEIKRREVECRERELANEEYRQRQ